VCPASHITGENGLVLRGIKLSKITEKGNRLFTDSRTESKWFLRILLLREAYEPSNEIPEEAVSRTLAANLFDYSSRRGFSNAFRGWWARILALRMGNLEEIAEGSGSIVTDLLTSLGQRRKWLPSLKEVMGAMKNKNVLVLAPGVAGLSNSWRRRTSGSLAFRLEENVARVRGAIAESQDAERFPPSFIRPPSHLATLAQLGRLRIRVSSL